MSLFKLWFFFTVVPNLGGLAAGVITASVFAIIAGIIIYAMGRDAYREAGATNVALGTRVFKTGLTTLVLASLLAVLAPSEKQMYLIAGGYVATNNAEVQKLPVAVLKSANAWLERLERAASSDKATESPKKTTDGN